jgi:hypothetical protein
MTPRQDRGGRSRILARVWLRDRVRTPGPFQGRPGRSRGREGAGGVEPGSFETVVPLTGDRRFEPLFLRQRVCGAPIIRKWRRRGRLRR